MLHIFHAGKIGAQLVAVVGLVEVEVYAEASFTAHMLGTAETKPMELPGKLMMGNLELIPDGATRSRSMESNTSCMARPFDHGPR